MHRLLIHMRKDWCDAFRFTVFHKILKGIHSGTVKCRNTSHTKHQTFGKIFHYNVFNRIGCSKEQRSGNLIDADLFRKFLHMIINCI